MPDIGIPELLIILVIVVLIFGAGRVTDIMGALGKGVAEFRRGTETPPQSATQPPAPAVTPAQQAAPVQQAAPAIPAPQVQPQVEEPKQNDTTTTA